MIEKTECQVVGVLICPACGKSTSVKVNKNGILFTYCRNEINEETGEKCCHRVTWGRAESRKFLRDNNIEVLKHGNTGISNITGINSGNNDNSAGQCEFAAIWGN